MELERDDPKLAFQAARLLGLHRRLWESCVSKRMRGDQLGREIHDLTEAVTHTTAERNDQSSRHDNLRAKLHAIEQALQSSRKRIMTIMDTWHQCERGTVDSVIMDVEDIQDK